MIMHIVEEIKSISSTTKDLRSFGLVVGGVLTALAGFSWYRGGSVVVLLGAPGLGLMLLGFVQPRLLLPLQKLWMSLAVILGWVMTRVIIGLLFFIIVTPAGLLMRLVGKKLLEGSFDQQAKSYWERRASNARKKENYEHQF
ncbi:MAG: SxtJ family membrane protein [Patescibacteria group bacterium]